MQGLHHYRSQWDQDYQQGYKERYDKVARIMTENTVTNYSKYLKNTNIFFYRIRDKLIPRLRRE